MGAKNVLRQKENSRFLDKNGPFFARRSRRNYMILSNAQDIRRKWADIGPFCLKLRGHFTAFAPQETRFTASGMWDFAGVRAKTGSRQA